MPRSPPGAALLCSPLLSSLSCLLQLQRLRQLLSLALVAGAPEAVVSQLLPPLLQGCLLICPGKQRMPGAAAVSLLCSAGAGQRAHGLEAGAAARAPMYESVTSSPAWMSRSARITAAGGHGMGGGRAQRGKPQAARWPGRCAARSRMGLTGWCRLEQNLLWRQVRMQAWAMEAEQGEQAARGVARGSGPEARCGTPHRRHPRPRPA